MNNNSEIIFEEFLQEEVTSNNITTLLYNFLINWNEYLRSLQFFTYSDVQKTKLENSEWRSLIDSCMLKFRRLYRYGKLSIPKFNIELPNDIIYNKDNIVYMHSDLIYSLGNVSRGELFVVWKKVFKSKPSLYFSSELSDLIINNLINENDHFKYRGDEVVLGFIIKVVSTINEEDINLCKEGSILDTKIKLKKKYEKFIKN